MIFVAEMFGAFMAGAVTILVSGVFVARHQFRKMRSPRVLR